MTKHNAKQKEPKSSTDKKQPAVKKTKKGKAVISAQQRYEMVQTAAYFIAERTGFTGDLHECWVEAEKQIEKMLSK